MNITTVSEEKQSTILAKIKRAYKKQGFPRVFLVVLRSLRRRWTVFSSYNYYKFLKSSKKFVFNQKEYKYFYHKYNGTWRCERAVEVPIIWNIVQNAKGNILEVGNVLSHYFTFSHDILDKYENAKGVINQDIVEFIPSKKYDLIISISTLEHVGWNENAKDCENVVQPEKIFKGVANLRALLNVGGKIIVTFPIGYNLYLDKALKNGTIKFDELNFLKRVSKDNRWVQTNWKNVENLKYNHPFPFANGIVIGVIGDKLYS